MSTSARGLSWVGRVRRAVRRAIPRVGASSLRRWPAMVTLAVLAWHRGGAETAEPVALTGHAMGTGWSVKYIAPAGGIDPEMVDRAVSDRLEELERMFSTYRVQSTLSRFNAATDTDWVPVAPEMAQVASESRRISDLTAGAYDVTVFPLVRLWGFGGRRRSGSLPTAEEIVAARSLVDWRKLEVRLDPPALRKAEPRLAIDFASMAKGFAADAIGSLLARMGAPQHFVQVGGDIKTGGDRGDGVAWHAAIEQPLDASRAIACVVNLRGQALSTSGDYRNFFHVGRQRYGHIIDPRTGQPPTGSLASVSVVHAWCADSSALATALFVLGPDEGFRLAVQHGLACLFMLRSGNELERRATPAFERLLE